MFSHNRFAPSPILLVLLVFPVGFTVAQDLEYERAAARFGALQTLLQALEAAEFTVDGDEELAQQLFYARDAADLRLSVGQGITYGTTVRIDGEVVNERELTITLLLVASDGAEVWGYTVTRGGRNFYLEAAFDRYGITSEVRQDDPYTPEVDPRRYETRLAQEFGRVVESDGLEAAVEEVELFAEQMRDGFVSELFPNPERLGSETVAVEAGSFDVARLRSEQEQGIVNLWYNQQTPGAIVRYRLVSSDGSLQLDGELIEISNGHTERFGAADLVLQPERDDASRSATDSATVEDATNPPDDIESSKDDPVVTGFYDYHAASLAPGESDFYQLTIPAGETAVITAYAVMTEVELTIYGTDGDFQSAQYRDTGFDTRFESPLYPERTTIFFTVSAEETEAYELFVIEGEDR